MTLGDMIKGYRESHGLSQRAFARNWQIRKKVEHAFLTRALPSILPFGIFRIDYLREDKCSSNRL